MSRRLAVLGVALVGLSLAACSDRAGAQRGPVAPPPVPVGVATAERKTVPLQVTTVGNVQAYTTVTVRPQVAGQIQEVHFKEGQDVKRGDLLFTIDQRPLQAAVRQAEANVAKDQAALRQTEAALAQRHAEVTQAQANLERDLAQLEMAKVQNERYRELVQRELVAREQYDQVKTTLAAAQATVQADRAAVENARASARAAEAMVENARAGIKANEAMMETARLQLAYTTIRAPMDGRTGNLLVQAGNVVKANEGDLVVIAQVRPIYVSFAVPELQLTAVTRFQSASGLKVEAMLDGGQRRAVGSLTFLNNTVDPSTGTIQLKATFANTDNALWPGQFVDVALTLVTEDAVLVPAQAVQAGQQGPFVFVVKPDLTVESRTVKPGRRLAGGDLVIEQGLAGGEQVVTDGQLRLVPGARVEIKPPRSS
jgi:multidrug efflux system membrane fusion protein